MTELEHALVVALKSGDGVLSVLSDLIAGTRISSEELHRFLAEFDLRLWSPPDSTDPVTRSHYRLTATPRTFVQRDSVAILSSRRPRDLENQGNWLDHFRTAVFRCISDRRTIVTSEGTTCDRLIRHAAKRFQIEVLNVEIGKEKTLTAWLDRIIPHRGMTLSVSPPDPNQTCDASRSEKDEWVMFFSHWIYLLGLRRKSGTLQRLIRSLQRPHPPRVLFTRDPELIDGMSAQTLENSGAIRWMLSPAKNRSDRPSAIATVSSRGIIDLDEFQQGTDFLYHCTRKHIGPWPDQDEDEHVDELLCTFSDGRSCLASLRRIISTQRIVSGDRFNRAQESVVSFTELTLHQIRNERKFRSHLSRWDFEPFGVGIRRKALMRLGCQKVVYGTSDDYSGMPKPDRFRFQKATTMTRGGKLIDWRREKEWRIRQDVDLRLFDAGDLIYFVNSESDAYTVRTQCQNLIVVVNEAVERR